MIHTSLNGNLGPFNLLLLCLAMIGLMCPAVLCQAAISSADVSYVIVGRVVNSNGVPYSDAGIYLEPVKYHSDSFERFIEGIATDPDGRFKFVYNKEKAARAGTFMIFVLVDNDKNALSTVMPPFDTLRLHSHNFDGQVVTFGKKGLVDVGDIRVKFWFGTAKLKLSKPLPWRDVYLIVRDGSGHRAYSGSMSRENIEKYVKDNGSRLDISLPEGNWKVELRNWNGKKIFAKSSRFEINRNQSLEISMLN